jgi:hypothetical protein
MIFNGEKLKMALGKRKRALIISQPYRGRKSNGDNQLMAAA